MDLRLGNIHWFRTQRTNSLGPTLEQPSTTLMETPKEKGGFDIKMWGFSLFAIAPWIINAKDKISKPTTINRGLIKRAQPLGIIEKGNMVTSVHFRPYVAKVPWHTGARAFLSQLFPRYGHYCGPNWSSGKDNGSLIWDQRPIDWLDFCCYCHDIGYDTHDQAKLLEADLTFLECLEKPNMRTKGDVHVAQIYKRMCITGMQCITSY